MYYLGLDVGGTKIEAGIVDRLGNVMCRERVLTHAADGSHAVLNRIHNLLDGVLADLGPDRAQVGGLGVGVPGAVDEATGIIHTLVNLTGWSGMPLRDILHSRYRLPTFITNDANAAALGEYMFGNGAGFRHMLYITASTGIGGGIIIDGNIVSGANGAAGEVGHMVLEPHGEQCGCGNRGCWETISSGTAIAKTARQRIMSGEKSLMTKLADIEAITAEHVFLAHDQGDALAAQVVDRALYFLGLGIANLVNILNPEGIVLGGGVTGAGQIVFSVVESVVQQLAYGPAKTVRIRPARLGAQAGVVGAAALAMKPSNNR